MADGLKHTCITTGGKFRLLAISSNGALRVRKDALRIGDWVLDTERWQVDAKKLSLIASETNRCIANGNKVPLIFDHDGGSENRAGSVVKCEIVGDTLWTESEIDQPKYLSLFGDKPGDLTPHEVSGHFQEGWVDGLGNKYAIAMVHLAVCVNPVVPSQQPFMRLSIGANRVMAKAKELAEGDPATDTFTVEEVKGMLAKAGCVIPDSVGTKEALMAAFEMWAGESGLTEEVAPEVPAEPEVTDAMMMSASPAQLRKWTKGYTLALSNEKKVRLALEQKAAMDLAAREADAKKAFETKLDSLVTAGKIHLSHKPDILADGKDLKWRMSLLTRYDDAAPVVPTKGTARQLGIVIPAADDKELSKEEKAAAGLAMFGLKPKA